jgi:hypothetical protein
MKTIASLIVEMAIVAYAAVRYSEMSRIFRFIATARNSPTAIVPGTNSAV